MLFIRRKCSKTYNERSLIVQSNYKFVTWKLNMYMAREIHYRKVVYYCYKI